VSITEGIEIQVAYDSQYTLMFLKLSPLNMLVDALPVVDKGNVLEKRDGKPCVAKIETFATGS
jgi:hypothetical protein